MGVSTAINDLSDFRLEKARALGVPTCNSAKEDLKEKAVSVFGTAASIHGKTADLGIYIDAAGVPNLIETFLEEPLPNSREKQ